MAEPRTPELRRTTATSERRRRAVRVLAALVREHTPRTRLRQICELLAEKKIAEVLTLADLVAAMHSEQVPASPGSSRNGMQPRVVARMPRDLPATIEGVDVIVAPLPSELWMPLTAPRRREGPRLPALVEPSREQALHRTIFLSSMNTFGRVILELLQRLGGWVTAAQVVDALVARRSADESPGVVVGHTLLEVRFVLQRLVDRGEVQRRSGRPARYTALMASCI